MQASAQNSNMASAGGNLDLPPMAKKIFCGPAGQEFASFQELAIYSMDNYYPNWRNYDHPESYCISSTVPSSYTVKFFIRTIQQMIDERFQAPFLAIDLSFLRNKVHLSDYFPTVPWKDAEEMLESNFREGRLFLLYGGIVLIGPTIGIIAVEILYVLDNGYKLVLKESSKKIASLFRLLETCTGIKIPNGIRPKSIVSFLKNPNVFK